MKTQTLNYITHNPKKLLFFTWLTVSALEACEIMGTTLIPTDWIIKLIAALYYLTAATGLGAFGYAVYLKLTSAKLTINEGYFKLSILIIYSFASLYFGRHLTNYTFYDIITGWCSMLLFFLWILTPLRCKTDFIKYHRLMLKYSALLILSLYVEFAIINAYMYAMN